MVYYQDISASVGLFWDDFPKNNSERDLDPTTDFQSSLGFFEFF